jgi:hypothetical protein
LNIRQLQRFHCSPKRPFSVFTGRFFKNVKDHRTAAKTATLHFSKAI